MPSQPPFVHKLLKRFERVDKESAQIYLRNLAQENHLCWEILDALDEGIVLLAADGSPTWLNARAQRWLGFQLASSPRGHVTEWIDDPELRSFLRKKLAGLQYRASGEVQILAPQEMTLRIILLPLTQAGGGEILMLLTDISEESSWFREQERGARIEALVSLAAGVAHEIGNPLNSISIHLQLLKKELENVPDAQKSRIEKMLGVVTAETSRLDAIVKNFLRAARRPPLRFQLNNLNKIVQGAVDFMKPQLETQKITVQMRPDPHPPSFMIASDRLHQVFINLIKNAQEAMPEGGLLRISVGHKGKVASVRIQDGGMGIPSQDLPYIFDAYFTTKKEGSGLGLMTVYDSITEHGGKIDVASKVGEGTTFTIWLPMRQPRLQLPEPEPDRGAKDSRGKAG